MPSHKTVSHTSAHVKGAGAHHKPTKHKTVKITHRHNKAYRRRHLLLLTLSVLGLFAIGFLSLRQIVIDQHEKQNARDYIANIYQTNDGSPQEQLVSSTYGFNFRYNSAALYGSAVDSTTGGLFVGDELSTNRAYETIKLSSTAIAQPQSRSTVTITYHSKFAAKETADHKKLEEKLVKAPRDTKKLSYTRESSLEVALGGKLFTRSVWTHKIKTSLSSSLTSSFVSYTGIVNGHPLTIEITLGLDADTVALNNDIQTLLDSLSFGTPTVSAVPSSPIVNAKKAASLSLLDRILFTGLASAASAAPEANAPASEKVSSLYGPAVVKVFNAYCMDISLQGQPYLRGACQAVAGSGFFVSSDGYLGTNGHVASSSPKDIVIADAIANSQQGNDTYFNILVKLAKLSASDLSTAGKTQKQFVAAIIDKFYDIPDSVFSKQNDVSNLLIDLNGKQPDITELINNTKQRKSYPEQPSIKHAKLIASNYKQFDGIDGFRGSDVAIMKIDGSDFPVVKLGSIDNVSQGGSLNILGYPANASDNGIVDSKEGKVTLTTGKVSSIKNASGSDKKLIETDTTIGHGNSGGPTFDDSGNVIGIATYTADGSGKGNGVYNYVRDIKDLKDLASKNSVSFNTSSKTQKQWEQAIDAFYSSHYSKSLSDFEAVKKLYPEHPTVDSLITTAKARIASGYDVKDFPVVPLVVGVVVLLAGAGTAAVLIIRHKKTHNIYRNQVAQNGMNPVTPANSPQVTTYDVSQYGRMGQPVIPNTTPQPQQQFQAAPAPVIQPHSAQQPAQAVQQPTVTQPTTIPVAGPTVVTPTAQPQAQTQTTTPPNPPLVQ